MARIGDCEKPKIPTVEPGLYPAICVYSVEIGEQLKKYGDKSGYEHQVMLAFELCGELIEIDGKQEPKLVEKCLHMTSHEKGNLFNLINGWLGAKYSRDEIRKFDTNDLVGLPACVNVVMSKDGQWNNIDSIVPLPKGLAVGEPVHQLIRFDMKPWNQAAFEALPGWVQDRIKKSIQYQKEHPSTETIAVQAAPAATVPAVGGGCPI